MHIVSIHQPEFMPYLGFFHKMAISDTFVLLDTVQFKKNNYQNRNRINCNNAAFWLSFPLVKHSLHTLIKDIEINYQIFSPEKHLKTIKQHYIKTPYFHALYPEIELIYQKKHQFLKDFNTEFILMMVNKLQIKTEIIKASEMPLSGTASGGTEVTLEICKSLNATGYISGSGGKSYLDINKYAESNIDVYFQHYNHPKYFQMNTNQFLPYLSVIDLYFNHGHKSNEIIFENNEKNNLKVQNIPYLKENG